MNFGSGTSRVTRGSVKRDPELIPAIPGRLGSFVTVRQVLPQSPQRAITSRTTRAKRSTPYQRRAIQPPAAVQAQEKKPSTIICPICFTDLLSIGKTQMRAIRCCGYVFCERCIMKHASKSYECPMCKQTLTNAIIQLRFCEDGPH